MKLKKMYSQPVMVSEKFVPQDYIATCWSYPCAKYGVSGEITLPGQGGNGDLEGEIYPHESHSQYILTVKSNTKPATPLLINGAFTSHPGQTKYFSTNIFKGDDGQYHVKSNSGWVAHQNAS